MQEKTQNSLEQQEYACPECTIVNLGKEDILTTSSIYLPLQQLSSSD